MFTKHEEKINIIIDHDGATEDLISLIILLQSDKFNIAGITISNGDCYVEDAYISTLKIIKYYGKSIPIGINFDSGTNQFPDKWRYESKFIKNVDSLSNIYIENIEYVDAIDLLVDLLMGSQQYIILSTGPLVNIASAIKKNVDITKNIKTMYIMGGAINVPGNVEFDNKSEWNFYNNPCAASIVFKSKIPIILIPLDATNMTPIDTNFLFKLKSVKNGMLPFEIWNISLDAIENGYYYFWDTLTATCIIDNSIIQTKSMKIKISDNGQTEISENDGENIHHVAFFADAEKLKDTILTIFN